MHNSEAMEKRMKKAPIKAKNESNSSLFMRIILYTCILPTSWADVKIISIRIFANFLTQSEVFCNFLIRSTGCAKVPNINQRNQQLIIDPINENHGTQLSKKAVMLVKTG